MKGLLKIWLIILAGAGIGAVVVHDSGYVLLSAGVYTVEMSLALLLMLLVAAFAGVYFLIRLFVRTRRLRDVVLVGRLESAITRLNPWISDDNLHKAVRAVTNVSAASLYYVMDSSPITVTLFWTFTAYKSLTQSQWKTS